jgi:hypothetical protein
MEIITMDKQRVELAPILHLIIKTRIFCHVALVAQKSEYTKLTYNISFVLDVCDAWSLTVRK